MSSMNGRVTAKAHLFSQSSFCLILYYDTFLFRIATLKSKYGNNNNRDAACFVSLSCFRVRAEPIQALIDDRTEKMARTRRVKCYFSIILYDSGDIK
jgi:hypothetical protein